MTGEELCRDIKTAGKVLETMRQKDKRCIGDKNEQTKRAGEVRR